MKTIAQFLAVFGLLCALVLHSCGPASYVNVLHKSADSTSIEVRSMKYLTNGDVPPLQVQLARQTSSKYKTNTLMTIRMMAETADFMTTGVKVVSGENVHFASTFDNVQSEEKGKKIFHQFTLYLQDDVFVDAVKNNMLTVLINEQTYRPKSSEWEKINPEMKDLW